MSLNLNEIIQYSWCTLTSFPINRLVAEIENNQKKIVFATKVYIVF